MTYVRQRGEEILKRLPSGDVLGAEVGVWDGRLSDYLLTSRSNLSLLMVDRWQEVEPTHRYRQSNSQMATSTQSKFIEIEHKAFNVAVRHDGRGRMLKGESVDVARCIDDSSLDFVFVDADHSYEGVKEDIAAWFPKLKKGGLLGGHDWDHPQHIGEWGVCQAVEEFAEAMGFGIQLGKNRTWFLAAVK